MLKKSLMILSIAMAALVSALPQGTPPAAGPPPATTPLAIANSDAFTQFSYYGGSQAQTFTVPSGTNKGVFVEVVSKCWYTAGATINGQPATGINTTPECTDSSKAGNKNRQILYYVPAGTPSITLTVQAGQPVAVCALIRCQRTRGTYTIPTRQCRRRPTRPPSHLSRHRRHLSPTPRPCARPLPLDPPPPRRSLTT
ncbi:hypothetical protein BC828DRAFT_283569 [Blastocladiella britannica]|nr:hypothetical protein BC828DRAFT_283569 [Blastocladiella britannica]